MLGDEDFHALNQCTVYGYALDGSWLVYALRPLQVGEYIEVLGVGQKVMAQGRVVLCSRHLDDEFRFRVTLAPVSALDLLESSCARR